MKPWIHPEEGRARIYWTLQIIGCVVAALVIPVLLLREPTQDHILIALIFTPIAIIGALLGVKTLRGSRRFMQQNLRKTVVRPKNEHCCNESH